MLVGDYLRNHILYCALRFIGALALAVGLLVACWLNTEPVVALESDRVRDAASEVIDPKSRVSKQLANSKERFKTAEDWKKRRMSLREGFLRGAKLWPLPERSSPNAIIHSRRTYVGYSVENIALETMPGFYCTGNLYRPLDYTGPRPAVLSPNGHFIGGRFSADEQIVSAQLARMGAIVFSYSMVGVDDSSQTTHADPNALALQTWNSIRVVDYLSSLKEVDSKRIGVTGASGGGSQALFLTLVDDRIAASAAVVIVYGWSWFSRACTCENGMPVMREPETNAIELAAVAAPRPQLIVTCGILVAGCRLLDRSHDFPTTGFPFVKDAYRILSKPVEVSNVHFATEAHDFGPSKRKEVYAFFSRHLDLRLLAENLNNIRVEAPNDLEVFNDQHPHPPHALKGAYEIAMALREVPGNRFRGLFIDIRPQDKRNLLVKQAFSMNTQLGE